VCRGCRATDFQPCDVYASTPAAAKGGSAKCCAISGWDVIGLDPANALLEEARKRDPQGVDAKGVAGALPIANGRFGLIVSYLSV